MLCVCWFVLLLTSLLSSVKVSFLPFRFLYIFLSVFSFAVTSMNVTCWPLPHFATVIWSNCFLFTFLPPLSHSLSLSADCHLCSAMAAAAASNLRVNFSWMSYFSAFSLSLSPPPLPLILFFLSNYTAIFHVPFLFHLFIFTLSGARAHSLCFTAHRMALPLSL